MQSTTSSTRTFMNPQSKKPQQQESETPKGSRFRAVFSRRNLPWLIVAILLLVSVFLYTQYHQAQTKLKVGTPQYYSSANERLGKLIILPTNEKPTVITVKDASKLNGQIFYKDAKNGDITFVYSKARKAILYRPSSNIVVNVAPVNVSPSASSGG